MGKRINLLRDAVSAAKEVVVERGYIELSYEASEGIPNTVRLSSDQWESLLEQISVVTSREFKC